MPAPLCVVKGREQQRETEYNRIERKRQGRREHSPRPLFYSVAFCCTLLLSLLYAATGFPSSAGVSVPGTGPQM